MKINDRARRLFKDRARTIAPRAAAPGRRWTAELVQRRSSSPGKANFSSTYEYGESYDAVLEAALLRAARRRRPYLEMRIHQRPSIVRHSSVIIDRDNLQDVIEAIRRNKK